MIMNTMALVSASTDGPALFKLSITFAIASASLAHPSMLAVLASATSGPGVLGRKMLAPKSRKDDAERMRETSDTHQIIRSSCVSRRVDVRSETTDIQVG